MVSATVRYDGSSCFGKEQPLRYFPASHSDGAYEEAFTQYDVISDLKLRFGWGQTGNQK
ncbi:MAG: hypothetical protein ACLUHA_11720 [Bacteroides stercoris]